MNIWRKFMILLFACVAVLFLFFLYYSANQRANLINLFKSEQARSQQVFNTLVDMQSRMVRAVAQDYTVWDEMAAYLVSTDSNWAKANLSTILSTFKVDAFWVYDLDGTVLYTMNSMDDGRLALPGIDPRQILKKGSIEHFFILTTKGLCEIYAATVHPTADLERKTPPRGYFLVGRLWTQPFVKELSELTGGVVSLIEPEQAIPAPYFDSSYEKGVVVNRSPLLSWDGRQVAVLQLRTESGILHVFSGRWKRSILLFLAIGLAIISGFFLVVFLWITRPLRFISTALKKEDARYLSPLDKSRDEFGPIAKLIGNFFWQREQLLREIKERSLAEEKISRAAREWRTTFDALAEQVSVMDRDFRIVRVNKAFAQRFNMPAANAVGMRCYELLGRDKSCPRCPYLRALKTKTVSVAEYFVSEAGLYSEVVCSPIFDDAGEATGTVHIVKDITARKDVEKKQRLALLGKLVADMAHEVNNPLMIISGRSQLSLMEDIGSPAVKGNLKIIMDECQRAKEIIQRLLKFARPSAREMRPVNIQACIDTVVQLIEHQFSVAGITFVKHYLENPPPVVLDDRQMQEVFMNLFNNAREAMPTSGGVITITVSRTQDMLTIEVKDTGLGMPPEVKKKLFEPFFTTKARGTGLGLSVCYGIIKSYGGRLEFESEPQLGTAARIIFPITRE